MVAPGADQQLPFPPWQPRLEVAAEEPKTPGEIRVKYVIKGEVRRTQLLVLWPDLAEMLMIIRYIQLWLRWKSR